MLLGLLIIAVGGCLLTNNVRSLSNISLFWLFLVQTIIVGYTSSFVPDYNAYRALYEFGYKATTYDKGFLLYMTPFQYAGISYTGFRILTYSIIFLLLVCSMRKFSSKNTNLFCILYLFSPFVYDAIQIRNSLMMALLVWSTTFLIDFTKKRFVISIIFILLAASIQSLGYIFLIYPLIYIILRISPKNMLKIYIVVIFLMFIAMMNKTVTNNIIIILGNQLSSMRGVSNYLQFDSIHNGWIINDLIALFSFILVYFCYRRIILNNELNKNTKNKITILMALACVGLLTIPLSFIDGNFLRISRNTTFAVYVSFIMYFNLKKGFYISKSIMSILLVVNLLLYITIEFVDVGPSISYLLYNNNLFN
ncbi:EpsG family protein [Latilactobacillus curvatus]|uniref:EpsG family protein n=1 Tax=Latilactobacillus curvatus TaxID=28038 RepID=UPI0020C777C2|nr:EpsG family protein [Latilactobacillus curvatus]MCP8848753.1 EpsG family protein [Latilactobacillus curvatus]MCP8865429.1 EpsG family protein [Latilactobacillus curvatus]MCP8874305.1 EpsG family protein [Latilactobacillus curvatus]MCP8876099.1 EpsG family protein [Latilactobacillus curvatus]MCP8879693.1 EpsG family protein [Latilactobacillus curvatus]